MRSSVPAARQSAGGQNRNLLDNWYFVRPVNQRGQTSYPSGGYTIDRWLLDPASALSVVEGGVKISKNYWLQQIIDAPISDYVGQTVTLSVLSSAGFDTATFELGADLTSSSGATSFGGRLMIQQTATNPVVTIVNGGDENVIFMAAKLELGDQQTLARKEGGAWVLADPPPDVGLELAKCQRYQYRYNGSFKIHNWNNQRPYDTFVFPVTMRVAPVISQITYDTRFPAASIADRFMHGVTFQSVGGDGILTGFIADANL